MIIHRRVICTCYILLTTALNHPVNFIRAIMYLFNCGIGGYRNEIIERSYVFQRNVQRESDREEKRRALISTLYTWKALCLLFATETFDRGGFSLHG